MTTANISYYKDCLQMEDNRNSYTVQVQPTLAVPIEMPVNQEITTANKLDMPPKTRLAVVGCISGSLYAYSGNSDSTNLTSGQGIWCPEGEKTEIPVGFTNGVMHDKLLVVASE